MVRKYLTTNHWLAYAINILKQRRQFLRKKNRRFYMKLHLYIQFVSKISLISNFNTLIKIVSSISVTKRLPASIL